MNKLTTNTGIVLRQKLDKTIPVFTNTPDVILSGTSALFDPSSLLDYDAYRWYFSQAPVPGSPNFVYLRGLNYSPAGKQNSRVYLYWVSAEHLLDPAQWQTSGFRVGNADQNHVPITAQSRGEFVSAELKWTPPQAECPRYYLISWVDNNEEPTPPEWPATPFADLAAFGQYVTDHPTMAVLDTVYQGAFLRQFPKQTVFQGGTGARTSPDLIVTGASAVRDAASFGSAASYDSDKLSATAALGVRNFVYVRALNTTSGPASARVYLYWARSSDVTPTGWHSSGFTFAGQTRNWVDLTAAAGNDVMVSTVPLVWFTPSSASDLPVLIAYVDNSAVPQPPDFAPFGYVNPATVAKFVAGHPQLTWLAITGTTATQPTLSWDVELAAGTGSNNRYVGVQLDGVPTDGTLSLSVPGPSAASTVVVDAMKVPDPNAFVAWPVTYPDNFQTSAVLSYRAGATPPGDAAIVATMVNRPVQGH